jgi:BolA protein
MTTERITRLRSALQTSFEPVHLEIVDDSDRHRGHAGAAGGGGHFRVVLVSSAFCDRSLLDRQRAVHGALGDLMSGEVHALALRTLTPEEWAAQSRHEDPGSET